MHYKNGREAVIGDPVVGVGYNHKEKIAGTLISITPQASSCNCQVLLNAAYTVEKGPRGTPCFVAASSDGQTVLVMQQVEYTQCDYLLHADDAFAAWEDAHASVETEQHAADH